MAATSPGRGASGGWEADLGLLTNLPSLEAEKRAEVVSTLVRSRNPAIRRRAIALGVVVISDEDLVRCLQNEADDVVRNAGLEILKRRGRQGFPLAARLLRDPDPGVALQAVLALDHIGDSRALEPLRGALDHPDPNVVQAAIIALGHLGDAQVVDDLTPFLSAELWVKVAAVQALGDLQSGEAIPALRGLLADVGVGSLAAEAVGRIGGTVAFTLLAERLLRSPDRADRKTTLDLLARVIEGLSGFPAVPDGLGEALVGYLADDDPAARVSAAACLLALGPGAADTRAVKVLADDAGNGSEIPDCLDKRPDLIQQLLSSTDQPRLWGVELTARRPGDLSRRNLLHAMRVGVDLGLIETVFELIDDRIEADDLALATLWLFVGLPPDSRVRLAPLLGRCQQHIRRLLAHWQDFDAETRLVLEAHLDDRVEQVVGEIFSLDDEARLRVIPQLLGRPGILTRLPWAEWVESEPDRYCGLLADVVASWKLPELLPVLRRVLESEPEPSVVRAVGDLGDRDSVPLLLRHLDHSSPLVRVIILDALGRVGGTEAREALAIHFAQVEPKEARIALIALAQCATEAEVDFFVLRAGDPDWAVRFASADVLARFSRPENRATLLVLAADPEQSVAERALAAINDEGVDLCE